MTRSSGSFHSGLLGEVQREWIFHRHSGPKIRSRWQHPATRPGPAPDDTTPAEAAVKTGNVVFPPQWVRSPASCSAIAVDVGVIFRPSPRFRPQQTRTTNRGATVATLPGEWTWQSWKSVGRAVIVGAFALAATPPAVGLVRMNTVTAQLTEANERASLVNFVDPAGHMVAPRLQSSKQARNRIFVPLRTEPPASFIDMLIHIEDKHARSLRHYFGMDLLASGKQGLCYLTLKLFDRCRGTSTLEHLIAGGSHGQIGGRGGGWAKFQEVVDGWSISIAHPLDEPATRRLIADSAPYAMLVDNVAGGEIWGLELATTTVFRKTPDQIDLAEQAILAGAVNRPLVLACGPLSPRYAKMQRESWDKVKARALLALEALGDTAEVRAARAKIIAMPMITAPAPLPATAAGSLSPRTACEAAGNPLRLGALVNDEAIRMAEAERAGQPFVTEVKIGIDTVENPQFGTRIEQALTAVEHANKGNLTRPLLTGDLRPRIFIAMVDRDGVIRRTYANSNDLKLDAALEPGSVSKTLVAMAAAANGVSADAELCNKRDLETGVHNANGDAGVPDCSKARPVTVQYAWAHSQNLSVLDLARSLNELALDKAAETAGARFPAGMPKANALTLGRITMTPRQLLALFQGLQRGVAGAPATAPRPHIVLTPPAAMPPAGVDASGYFASPGARAFMTRALQAPLMPSGTMAADPKLPLKPNEIGKTGSVEDDEGIGVARLAIGATDDGAFIAIVKASDGTLGRSLNMQPLWQQLRRELHRHRP